MSFQRRRESCIFNKFWNPAFAGVTVSWTFYEAVKIYSDFRRDEGEGVVNFAASAIKNLDPEPHFFEGGGGSDATILTTAGAPVDQPWQGRQECADEPGTYLARAAQLVFQLLMAKG